MENKIVKFDKFKNVYYITSLNLAFKKASLNNLISKGVYLADIPDFDLLINDVDKHYFIIKVCNVFSLKPQKPDVINQKPFHIMIFNVTTFFSLHSEDVKKDHFYDILESVKNEFGMGNLSINETLNNVIFIFENMSWTGLQHCFRVLGFQLSGGSISLRHLASSVEMNLFKHLFALNISQNELSISRDFIRLIFNPKKLREYPSSWEYFHNERVNISQSFEKLLKNELSELTKLKNILLEKLTLLQEKKAMQKK